ncbi:MAG: pyruvate kinase [Patescibacteria group bacterium]
MKMVYTYGVWDLLHVGHIRMLQEIKALGDKLIVGVYTDDAAEGFKRRPVIPQDQRFELISSLKFVDEVVYQDEFRPDKNLWKIRPHILAKGPGAAWDGKEDPPGLEVMRQLGGEVILMKYHDGISTSMIIEKCKAMGSEKKETHGAIAHIAPIQSPLELHPLRLCATISPITPHLKDIEMARANGAFGTFEQMTRNLDPYLRNSIRTFVDIPNGRTKPRTNSYTDDEIIQHAKAIGVTFIALSYVGSARDLRHDYPTIAKIETAEGFKNIKEIAAAAQMILIDRRDLASAIGIMNVPGAVRSIIDTAHEAGKEVILASEFLFSMLNSLEPTLAEVENVRRAKELGADYLVLAEETAISKNPAYIFQVARDLCNGC